MLAWIVRTSCLCTAVSTALVLFVAPAFAIILNPVMTPTNKNSQIVSGSVSPGATVSVHCDPAATTEVWYPTSDSWSASITGLSEGSNTVTASADLGDPLSVTVVIIVDTQAPALVVSTLPNGSVTNNRTLNISGTASKGAGVDVVTLTVNGASVELVDGTFTYPLTLSEGSNDIITVATDAAGNFAQDERTVTLDQTAPQLIINAPADNMVTSLSPISVTGTANEGFQVEASVNGGPWNAAIMTGMSFSVDALLKDGVNTIAVSATDQATNRTTAKRTVTLDTISPTLQILDPPQDLVTNNPSYLVKGSLADAQSAVSVALTIGGVTQPLSISNGLFEQTVTFIANKSYPIIVTATDAAGNASSTIRNISYDSTPPVIVSATSASPAGHYGSGRELDITLNFSEPVFTTGISVLLSSQVTLTSGPLNGVTKWSTTYLVAEGQNTPRLEVTAVSGILSDAAGNQDTTPSIATGKGIGDTVTIVIDTQAPIVTFESTPADPTNSTLGSFLFLASEQGALECRIDSGSYSPCSSPCSYDLSLLPDGRHTFTVQATDLAGNHGPEASYSWTIDTTPPVVNVGPNQIHNAAFIQTATVNDATKLSYQWSQQTGVPGAVSFGSPNAPVTMLACNVDGSYLLRLTATDAVGNVAYNEMTLVWDSTAPSVYAGGDKITGIAVTQTATASDATALSFRWTQQSGAPGAVSFGAPTASTTTLSARGDGSYLLRLTVTDAAGNSSYAEMTLVWDTTPPLVVAGGDKNANAAFLQVGTAIDATALSYQWSQQSGGPGVVHFATPGAPATTITASVDGKYLLRLTATDAAGNSSYQEMTLTWDTTKPVMEISTLPNNSYTKETSITVSGLVSDQVSGVQRFTVNGVDVPLDSNGMFSHTVPLTLGANIISIVATDFATNASFDVRTVFLDPAAPTVNITSPGSNYKTNQPSVTVTGTVDKECTVSIHVTGGGLQQDFNSVPVLGNIFTLKLEGLAPGLSTIDVNVTSNAGLQSTKSLTVIYDNQKPLLDVTTPAGDFRALQNSVVISGMASDVLTGVTVTITDGPAVYTPQVLNGVFSQTIPLALKGVHQISIAALDEAGNQSILTRRVIYDTLTGDLNGDGQVTIADALLALQVSVGMLPQLDSYLVKGDVGPLNSAGQPDPDWKIDISDVVLILRIIVGSLIL